MCSDYFIHQHIQDIESSNLFGMKVQVTQYHTHFSVNPPLHTTSTAFDTWASMLQAGIDPACIMAVIISREWIQIYSCQNTSIFTAADLFCGRNQCKTQCQLPKQDIIADTMLENTVNEAGCVCCHYAIWGLINFCCNTVHLVVLSDCNSKRVNLLQEKHNCQDHNKWQNFFQFPYFSCDRHL